MRFFALIFMSSLVLSGCADTVATPQVVANSDKVSLMLANAADKASTALQTLAAIEQTRTPGAKVAPIANAPPELKRGITINWVGPAQNIAKLIAERASYSFEIIGNEPAAPIVVTIDVENRPIIDVLRDIGLQLNNRGKLVVDSTRRAVELQFDETARPNQEG